MAILLFEVDSSVRNAAGHPEYIRAAATAMRAPDRLSTGSPVDRYRLDDMPNHMGRAGKTPAPAGPHMSRRTGDAAESVAAAWLTEQGLTVIGRNWLCRFGEIDLVLHEGPVVVFAEVRLRGNPRFGGAAASIDSRKRQRLIAAAQLYLATRPTLAARPCRFDAVLMNNTDGAGLEWIRNAFDA